MDKQNEPEKGGSLCGLLQESGKIAFGIELPPIEILSFRDQKRIENNFLSFIKNIKNINHKKISFFKRQKYFSKEEGNFSPKVFPGNKVSKGDLVGVLVNSNAKLALIKVITYSKQDGTPNLAGISACTLPGDSMVTQQCFTPSRISSTVTTNLANEEGSDYTTIMVRTSSAGYIRTFCEMFDSGSLIASCSWYLVGYMD